MKPGHYLGIRSKIILCTIVCVVAVGLVSNASLYRYMRDIITEKTDSVDQLYAGTVGAQLDYAVRQAKNIPFYCANADEVLDALRYGGLESTAARTAALRAQNAMNAYLRTSSVEQYVNKILIFNERGMLVHGVSAYFGAPNDLASILASEQFHRWKSGPTAPFSRVFPSVDPSGSGCFALLSAVYSPSSVPLGYVYVEFSTDLLSDVMAPYGAINKVYLETREGDRLAAEDDALLDAVSRAEDGLFTLGGIQYLGKPYPLAEDGLTLVSCVNQTALQAGNQNLLFSLGTVLFMILLIATAVLILLTHYITRPIQRIMDKINRIAMNDYSFDPALESPHNEMGEIGARLNELGLGFRQLLKETIDLHDQGKEIEMAMLQSQVNPHFLYNTLNSIHWMAVVQKNPGIVSITQSLVKLLQNLSKGVSAKIPLSEELSLLMDYINIQSIRYLETFEYICRVPERLLAYPILKFTLQPIVENAIFHGIVPKGTFGTIVLDAREEGAFLVLTVTDDGVGMTQEEISSMLRAENRIDKSAMSGIGIANVNQRLKLAYGPGAGLSVESEKGVSTTVSVRIRNEWEEE